MRVLWRYGLPILLVACVVHVAAVLAAPIVVMHAVMARIEAMAGLNAPLHAPPIDARARGVPLPSPDLLYSSCVIDVSRGPVLVSAAPGAAYLSLALFNARSDNVFVANDEVSGGLPINVLVVGPGQEATPPVGAVVARLGGARGVLLLRGLAATPELAAISDRARRTLVCKAK